MQMLKRDRWLVKTDMNESPRKLKTNIQTYVFYDSFPLFEVLQTTKLASNIIQRWLIKT